MNGANSDWTPDMIATVKRHWGDKTARQIGELIGKPKNAVLGKAHRLGMSETDPDAAREFAAMQRAKLNKKKLLLPRPRRRLTFTSGCQWLDGDPRERNFCGDPAVEGSAYCEAHRAICTQRAA